MRTLIYLFAIALALTGCTKDEVVQPIKAVDEGIEETTTNTTGRLKSNFYSTDESGQVHIVIHTATTFGQHPVIEVDLPRNYVLIGGGAYVEGRGAGALLTESYPDYNKSTWHAASKDHLYPYAHNLTGYAIGLKIDGIETDELKNYIAIFEKTSELAHHPETTVSPIYGYKLIGGGAKVNWTGQGNLLVHSYPTNNTWYAKSKDHGLSSHATITAYAIGIVDSIPNFGSLDIQVNQISTNSYVRGYHTCTVDIEKGWVVSCPGARATFSGAGRMLTGIIPTTTGVTAVSKDHAYRSSGRTYSYVVKIRKKQ